MTTIRQILAGKPDVFAIDPEATVLDALRLLEEKNVGALLVMKGASLVGIFSERDYARKVVLQGKSSNHTKVSDVMSGKVVYVTPDRTIEECMAIMTEKHFRHLPVLDDERNVVGIVSIGDLIKETISQQKFIIEQLEHYITR